MASKMTVEELKAGIEAKEKAIWQIEMSDRLTDADRKKIDQLTNEKQKMQAELKALTETAEKTEEATEPNWTLNVYEKLSRIQAEMKAPKNLYNNFGGYHYRNAEGICEAFKKYESIYGVMLKISDSLDEIAGRVYIKATAEFIDCETGDKVSTSALAREPEDKKGMDSSQITGTASSYARKYALNGLLLLDDTKDADSDEYHEETTKKASKADYSKPNYPNVVYKALATEPQKNLIKELCEKHSVDLEEWLKKKNATFETLTMEQAGNMLNQLKKVDN